VNAIRLAATLLHDLAAEPARSGEVAEWAARLEHSSRDLVDLLADLLELSQFDSGCKDLHETTFPLRGLVEECCGQVLPLAQAKGLTLRAEGPDPGLHVRADRRELGRALGNVLGNAVKFTATGGVTVHTAAGSGGEGVVIDVADTGPGIP